MLKMIEYKSWLNINKRVKEKNSLSVKKSDYEKFWSLYIIIGIIKGSSQSIYDFQMLTICETTIILASFRMKPFPRIQNYSSPLSLVGTLF